MGRGQTQVDAHRLGGGLCRHGVALFAEEVEYVPQPFEDVDGFGGLAGLRQVVDCDAFLRREIRAPQIEPAAPAENAGSTMVSQPTKVSMASPRLKIKS